MSAKNIIDCKVIMLPDSIRRPIEHINQLFKNENGVISYLTDAEDIVKSNAYFGANPQHLYFAIPYDKDNSLTHISMGDLIYNSIEKITATVTSVYGDEYTAENTQGTHGLATYNDGILKVIATTDPSLNLPLIDQSFISAYIDEHGEITDVRIEFERMGQEVGDYDKVKVNKLGCCIVVSTVKEGYTIEDMRKVARDKQEDIFYWLDSQGFLTDDRNEIENKYEDR